MQRRKTSLLQPALLCYTYSRTSRKGSRDQMECCNLVAAVPLRLHCTTQDLQEPHLVARPTTKTECCHQA